MFDGNTFTQFGTLAQTFTELGRTTLGTSGSTIQVSSLPNKKWLMVLASVGVNATNCDVRLRLGNGSLDTGSNYADRVSANGAADTTSTTQAQINDLYITAAGSYPRFFVFFIENTSSAEKTIQCWSVEQNTAGASNAANRVELVGKWTNTSNVIDTLAIINLNTGSFSTGSEVVVLGADPSDTGVTPFFNELGRGSWSSGASISSGTFTAKKYIFFTTQSSQSTTTWSGLWLNGESAGNGANYTVRYSWDGATDATLAPCNATSGTYAILTDGSGSTFLQIVSWNFGLNISGNDKLFISHATYVLGTGATSPPHRTETVWKWNQSSQVTQITQTNGAGNAYNGGEIVVYGSD